MPKSLSRLPAPHAHRRLLRRLRRPLRLPRPDHVRDRRRARRRRDDGAWEVTLDGGETRALRRAARRQRPPLGPALARAGVPRQRRFEGEQMHSHDYTGDDPASSATSASSCSGWATPRWTSRSRRASRPPPRLPRRPPRRVGDPEVPVRPAARPDLDAAPRRPVARCASAFMRRRCCRSAVGDMERYGLPKPDHRVLRGAPDDLRRHPRRASPTARSRRSRTSRG